MSFELLQLRESYRRFVMDFNDDKREVIMILSDMKYGTMNRIRIPPMIEADGKSNYMSKSD